MVKYVKQKTKGTKTTWQQWQSGEFYILLPWYNSVALFFIYKVLPQTIRYIIGIILPFMEKETMQLFSYVVHQPLLYVIIWSQYFNNVYNHYFIK